MEDKPIFCDFNIVMFRIKTKYNEFSGYLWTKYLKKNKHLLNLPTQRQAKMPISKIYVFSSWNSGILFLHLKKLALDKIWLNYRTVS